MKTNRMRERAKDITRESGVVLIAHQSYVFALIYLAFFANIALGQELPSIAKMPDLPQPFVLRNWKQSAIDFDALLFDPQRSGRHFPLIWDDNQRIVNDVDGFGVPSYVGDTRHNVKTRHHESIVTLAAVLGSTVVGLDKGEHAKQLPIDYHIKNGVGLYLNQYGTRGDSFWYDLLPSLLFYQLYSHYPETPGFCDQLISTAEVWLEVSETLNWDFDYTGFNFFNKTPVQHNWKEPDAAAGIACIEYLAFGYTGDKKYLDAADKALGFLEQRNQNPFYECLVPYGAYTAARSNAERGTKYSTARFIEWVLAGDNPRKWGAILEKWNHTEAYGLIGSVYPDYEYAFAMNTFQAVGIMAPIARYQDQYARDIAKWILNVAVNSRYFYADSWPKDQQSSYVWAAKHDPKFSIPYEGLRKQGTTRDYPKDGFITSGRLINENRDSPDKDMLLEVDKGGRIRYSGKITVTSGKSHKLIGVISHRSGWNGNPVTISIAETENGPAKAKLVYQDTTGPNLKHAVVDLEGELWIHIEGQGLTPGTKVQVEDVLVETRFRNPPHVGGDATVHGWAGTDLGIYGGAFSGFLGALVEPTDVEGILAIDPVATDIGAPKSLRTRLLFNPFDQSREVALEVGENPADVYDSIQNRFVAQSVKGKQMFQIPAKQAVMLVFCPAGKKLQRDKTRLLCDDIVIDYNVPAECNVTRPSR